MSNILITGANRGLGLEAVKQYLALGFNVFACCRNPKNAYELLNLASKTDHKITIYQLDLMNEQDITTMSNLIDGKHIDILMNVAGIWGSQLQDLGNLSTEEWVQAFRVNTIAPIKLVEAFQKNILLGNKKIIANISSIMGSIELVEGGDYIYRSSKAALNCATKTLARDLASKNITVIALHPGWVKTDMGGYNAPINPQESISGILKVLDSITIKDTGSFFDYKGDIIAW